MCHPLGFPLLSSFCGSNHSISSYLCFIPFLSPKGRQVPGGLGRVDSEFHSFLVSSSHLDTSSSLDVEPAVHQKLSKQARGKAGRAAGWRKPD